MKKRKLSLYLLAFFLPVVLAGIICIRNDVYPFGENCILHIDMYHQYAPFFTELMNKLKTGESLFYSFDIGLGSDFVSLFAYYLASPLNWLLIICPKAHVIEFMTILILVKIGLCGSSFVCYLQYHFKKTDYMAVVFAAFYALSGYMAAYSWDIMWLDCLALFPIVLVGLERLILEKKCGVYTAFLAISILSNFYIAIMVCIFCVIWFFVTLFEKVSDNKEKLLAMGRFAIYSLLAGGMGAVLIIPEAVILSYSGSSERSFPENIEMYFSILVELGRHCFDVEVYTGRDHLPNLYCGTAVLLFVGLYFLNKQVSWKAKIVRAVLIVFFWFSFANNLLDFLWHGMDFPDSLPARQSFIYIFLLLVISYEAYEKREGNRLNHTLFATGFAWGFLSLASLGAEMGKVAAEDLVITAVLVAGYGAFAFLYHFGKTDLKVMARYMAITLAIIEVYVNFGMTGLDTTSRTAYTKNWESVQSLLAQVESMDNDKFYRIEEMERLTKNDASLYGYRSSTVFSSLMNIGVGNFYRKIGMEGGKNFYSYSGSTALTSSLFSVKYMISSSPYEESPLRFLAAEDGQNYIYQNLYSLPLGFMIKSGLEECWNAAYSSPVQNLNRFAELLGADEMLLAMDVLAEVEEDVTKVRVVEDGYYYATYSDKTVTTLTVSCGERRRRFTKCDHGYILDLGWCRAGEVVEITNTTGVKNFSVQPYRLNLNALSRAYETLSAQTMQVEEFSSTKVTGTIDVVSAGDLIISIPNEKGWSVCVDGKKIECAAFMESLMKIPLDEGKHQIMLSYRTPGLMLGFMISLSSFVIFLLLLLSKTGNLKRFKLRKRG